MHQFLGIALAITLNLLHMGYTVGSVLTRISQIEQQVKDAKSTEVSVNATNVKVATVEAKLTAISEQLARIERSLEKR